MALQAADEHLISHRYSPVLSPVFQLWEPSYLTFRPHKALHRSALLENIRSAGLEVLKGRQIMCPNLEPRLTKGIKGPVFLCDMPIMARPEPATHSGRNLYGIFPRVKTLG